jgi:hypothetical protein
MYEINNGLIKTIEVPNLNITNNQVTLFFSLYLYISFH